MHHTQPCAELIVLADLEYFTTHSKVLQLDGDSEAPRPVPGTSDAQDYEYNDPCTVVFNS